jgi:hypothetical protein
MSIIFSMCSDGLGVRVEDSLPRDHWFVSPLEQFVLKSRAVKIPTWWENSAMVGNFPRWEKKSLPWHGSFSTAAQVLYAGNYLHLFSQCSVYLFNARSYCEVSFCFRPDSAGSLSTYFTPDSAGSLSISLLIPRGLFLF